MSGYSIGPDEAGFRRYSGGLADSVFEVFLDELGLAGHHNNPATLEFKCDGVAALKLNRMRKVAGTIILWRVEK